MPNGASKKNGMCFGCDHPHLSCCCAHLVLSSALFGLGLLALLFAWISDSTGRTVLNLSPDHLFHDAIAFMVAAVFFRRKF